MSEITKQDVSEDPRVESLDQPEMRDAELEQISGGAATGTTGETVTVVTATIGCKRI
jgi:hypothetical protein